MFFQGEKISCGELHMVGSLPEGRNGGSVRKLVGEILREYKEGGDLFAFLIPFSFSFYRKFGFELGSEFLSQKVDINQFAKFEQKFEARQIMSQEDVNLAKGLYEDFATNYNMARIKEEEEWRYRENGEFGQRDWMFQDKTHYSYLFSDQEGKVRAYFTYVFTHGPEGPFVGDMEILEIVYDGPEALFSLFGFFYGMRAKIQKVNFCLPMDMDLRYVLPDCDQVECKKEGHFMARLLNIDLALKTLIHPQGKGSYRIRVEDSFLSENTATYQVTYEDGQVKEVLISQEPADLEVKVETLSQMILGLIDLKMAAFRPGTILHAKEKLLGEIFTLRPVFLR